MRLLRDEQAYVRVVDDFVGRRLDASAFISRFQHLWKCDGAPGLVVSSVTDPTGEDLVGLYGAMDSVNELCDAYAGSLPSGHGYRVSEEQFRKEVESVTALLRSRAVR